MRNIEELLENRQSLTDRPNWAEGLMYITKDIRLDACQDEDKNYNYYSKAWHRSYGPKITISNRRVELQKISKTQNKTIATFPLKAFSGNYFLRAIFALKAELKLTENKQWEKKLPKSVQIDKAFFVRKVEDKIYRRCLKISGKLVTYDFCAYDETTGLTYHAATIEKAKAGLNRKYAEMVELEERLKDGGRLFTYKLLRRAGFCQEGIYDVADRLNLDTQKAYTQLELIEKMMNKPKVSAQLIYLYPKEFKAMGLADYAMKHESLKNKLGAIAQDAGAEVFDYFKELILA